MKSGRHMKMAGSKPKMMSAEPEPVSAEREEKKRGGMVKGKAPKARLDKRARGGRMTPKSPLSGANVAKMPYESTLTHTDTGGAGKEPRP